MRKILIKVLIWLMDNHESYHGINDLVIADWLARQRNEPGFQDYFRKRDLQILKTIGTGLSKEAYDIHVGQRLELLYLLQKVDQSFAAMEKRSKKKKLNIKGKKNEDTNA